VGSYSLSGEPRTGIVSRVQTQCTTEATHFLESQGEAYCEQGPNATHNESHSHTGEQRMGVVSRDQMQLTTKATYQLESQEQAL